MTQLCYSHTVYYFQEKMRVFIVLLINMDFTIGLFPEYEVKRLRKFFSVCEIVYQRFFSVNEMSFPWNVLSMKCLVYEMSFLSNVLSMKCPSYEMSFSMKCFVYEMSFLWNVLSMKYPFYRMPFLCNVLNMKCLFY